MKTKILYFQIIAGLILSLVCSISVAGESGGGGGKCKSDFMDSLQDAVNYVKDYDIPLPNQLRVADVEAIYKPKSWLSSLSSNSNRSAFQIIPQEQPIQNCLADPYFDPNSSYACSSIEENNIRIFCGKKGENIGFLNEPDEFLKMKVALHEVLWWIKEVDDSNQHVSNTIVDEIQANVLANNACENYANHERKEKTACEFGYKIALVFGVDSARQDCQLTYSVDSQISASGTFFAANEARTSRNELSRQYRNCIEGIRRSHILF